ncbi:MAG TPA: carbon-nitrogen hydrolase, partial [Polyangiaceae bacterium]|nr:carbon-nitrogen hydrolase [Polyangiaceae bacterium]
APDPKIVNVGLVQMSTSEDKSSNIVKASQRIREAAGRGAHIVCLQELFASPYFCQSEDAAVFDLAEPVDGPTVRAIAEAAKQNSVTVIAPIFERRAAGVYHNSLVVLGPGGEQLALYRKMHIPDDPNYYEKFYFAPGDLGFMAVPTPHAQLGPLICWDQWYPEAARLTAMRGAQILLYPTAIGWLPQDKAEFGAAQLDAWKTVQRGHAIANGVFVVAVNRVGHEPSANGGIQFWGHSFVADPLGVVLAEAGEDEEVLVVPLDLQRSEATRRNWPFFRDRRIDAYAGIERRFLEGKE